MKYSFKILVALAAVFTSSCSLVDTRANQRSLRPETRDVTSQARDAGDQSPRKRIMVLPFLDGTGGRSDAAAKVARETFIRGLKRSDDFLIVATSDFPKDPATFIKNGEYDLEAIGKIGGGLGLAGIVDGKVLEIKAKRVGDAVGVVRAVRARISATVQLRMVNTKNGSFLLNETRTADVEETTTRVGERSFSDRNLESDPKLIEAVVTEAFRATLPKIAQAVEKQSWEGRVAMVKGDRIYVNAGRLSGLNIGDILKITEEGEDVYDPENGSLLGKVPGRLKGTVELVSYFGKDGAVAIVHSGSGFRENDRVELY